MVQRASVFCHHQNFTARQFKFQVRISSMTSSTSPASSRNSSPLLYFAWHALLAIVISTGLTLLVLTFVDHRLEHPMVRHFDETVQAFVHSWTNPLLTRFMLALTTIGAIAIFCTALGAVMFFLAARRRLHSAFVLAGSILGALALNETLKQHFHRMRPRVPWSIGDEHTFSFPSGHSIFSVVLYGTLAYLALRRAETPRRRFEIIAPAVLLPLGIGLSRIYLGMHFPTDVLAGYFTGASWLAAVIYMDHHWRRLLPRAVTEPHLQDAQARSIDQPAVPLT